MRHAYEDAVNEAFIDEVGEILARAVEDGTDMHDYITELVDLYEEKIGPVEGNH